mgnify:CR=1 FL=1
MAQRRPTSRSAPAKPGAALPPAPPTATRRLSAVGPEEELPLGDDGPPAPTVGVVPPWVELAGSTAETGAVASPSQQLAALDGVREVDDRDGVKAYLDDGWVLVRPSGTEPIFRVQAEAGRERHGLGLLDRRDRQTSSNSGSSETEVKLLTVSPNGSPSSSTQVTTVTPVTK